MISGKLHSAAAASDMTVRMYRGRSEKYGVMGTSGAMLVSREVLDVDSRLFEKIRRHGSRVYRMHGAGYVRVRHGENQTWDAVGDEWFLDMADSAWLGWDPDRGCIADMDTSHMFGPFARQLR